MPTRDWRMLLLGLCRHLMKNQSFWVPGGFRELFRERPAYILKSMGNQRGNDLIKIPYAHVMAALRSKHDNEYGMSIYEYSSPLYKVESYLLAYLDSINVVPLESEWCVLEEFLNVKILPSLVDTKLGRKRRKCVKGVGENFMKSKRRNKCSICKRTGHKRATYVYNKNPN
ncbi:hypothetical protein H5410_003965 [Solanum commersonii]|uniref:Uncharacterized protein n=1 Tax=Solanum commersonii TaxID=4109 RepID=A0A9J6B6G1_SOLCO|nr:hypothetical protein H5410_003965 [Solanum commersonii]